RAVQFDVRHLKSLSQVIEDRRATNHFTNDSVSDDDLKTILHFAGQAPSGYNLQPWRFIVVREPENRKRLQKVSYGQEKVSEAAAVIIFLGMKEETKKWASDVFYEGVRRGLGHVENVEKNMKGAIDFITGFGMTTWVNKHVMISFSFAMLMAEALGYDTAPMEGFEPDKVKKEFAIPEEAEVIALLAIGKAKEPDKGYPGRFPLERIAFAEKYGMSLK
ncbi:MAG: nitroreductase family protein, partial [Verrucomicrobiota bacterium]|nr:nitroreductase family protein [Verrucomicrobiota bacterium]